jgi:hypothetical protein
MTYRPPIIEGEPLLRGVAEELGLPQAACQVRACRRNGRCCGALSGPIPVCLVRDALHREDSVALLKLCCTMVADYFHDRPLPLWLISAEPDAVEAAIRVTRSCLPRRHWRKFHSWLVRIGVRSQPALRASPPSIPEAFSWAYSSEFAPPVISRAAKAFSINSGPIPGLVASEDRI